ncbi:exo-beta-N-acetylmuramidase NamZ domain-containing protein [Gillisia sp. Q332]|uniref:exo-beta-N-acetylmuramidase NamZ family protein n=1 Tax=Gillisia xinjiangensis TaxID=3384765 RepID=UPI00391AAFDC
MINRLFKNTFLFVLITIVSCGRSTGQNEISNQKPQISTQSDSISSEVPKRILIGAERIEEYLPLLKNKRIGIIGNQTSVILNSTDSSSEEKKHTHLVDSLLALEVDIVRVFAPEHGFRGTADAGETVKDGKDPQTGLPIISLYGDNKKPKPEQLKDIDILVFDLQDVGARFYTYISSLHYVMEASAENKIPLIVLDRPNPNGHYVDGPVLNPKHQSFVGMHPVPVVHGMTMGEYARMINGEKWLKSGMQCDLEVIKLTNYDHKTSYSLPVKPSPNLPNDQAINLYPSLCFFEGTNVNAGRGTKTQFQVFGSPFLNKAVFDYTYTPQSMEGAKNPKHLGKLCYGRYLKNYPKTDRINLSWLIEAYNNTSDKSQFFNSFFTKLAGETVLQKQIENGLSEEEIRESWQKNLEKFKTVRAEYLLY